VIDGHVGVERVAGNFGVMPVYGEEDGRVAENAEVEGVVVYFQMYSPLNIAHLPKPCWKPAWNSLR